MAVPRAGNSQETPVEEWVIEDFGSLNTKVLRPAVQDNDFFWTQNWMPLAVGRYKTLYAEGSSLYTATGISIIYAYQYVINSIPYWAIFFSNGTALQINENDQTKVSITLVNNTFYNPSYPRQIPACAQFQNKYLAIVNTLQPSNYWLWDGSYLYGCTTSGSVSSA